MQVALKALSLLHIFIREPSGNGLAAASRRPELRKMMELRLNCRDLFEYNAASFILAYARVSEIDMTIVLFLCTHIVMCSTLKRIFAFLTITV